MYYEIAGTNARLLGSMHQWPADAGTQELPTWVWDAYHWCQQLYLETDLADAAQYVRLPDGSTLQSRLPASIWDALQRLLPSGADISSLKPWAALMALQIIGKAMVPGVEPQLAARGNADSKPVRYLETMAEFSGRVDHASAAKYAQAFERVILDFQGIQQVLQEMYRAWLSRRVDEVQAIVPRTLLGLPSVARLMLDNRNVAWLPYIEAAMQAPERTLIVVGAAHLPRSHGLLALLKRAGHEIRLLPEQA
jgi:uncharacterized protein YbaP (TraB family)